MAEYAGIGTALKMGDGASPEVFTQIAQVGDIKLGALTAGTYDTTTHDNTLAGYKDFITGLKDGGEVNFILFFDANAATHKDTTGGLLATFNANLAKNWQLLLGGYASPIPKWAFSGLITKLGEFEYMVDGAQKANCTIKIKGKPVLA